MSETADTVTCTRCGGVVALSSLATSATCPYCRTHVELAPYEVQKLVRYRAEVKGRLESAQVELGHAESWNRWYGGEDARKKNHPLIAVGVWLALVVLVSGLGYGAQALQLDGQEMATLMPMGMLGVCVLVIGGYLTWYYSGRRRSVTGVRLTSAPVTCPKCGAPHALSPGEVLEHCRFCAAPLLPDQRVMEHGRAEGERALWLAQIERARAERRGMATLSQSSAATAVPYIVVGSFLPMTLLGAAGFTVSFLMGNEKGSPFPGLLLLWALAGLNLGLIGLIYLYRRHRQEQLQRTFAALLGRFGGTTLPDLWAVSGWLDRHWAGPVPLPQLFRGPHFSALACSVQGFPLLVTANPVGASDYYPGFVSVRMGAWLSAPEQSWSLPAAVSARASFQALGFTLSLTRAGPVVLAEREAARRWVASGDGRPLADALDRLGALARELGAKPVQV